MICPHEPGVVDYIQHDSIVRHRITSESLCIGPCHCDESFLHAVSLAALKLPETDRTLYAAGGLEAELHISLHAPYPSVESLWESDTVLSGRSNNALLFSHVLGTEEPRLIVSNNDHSIKFFDVPLKTKMEAPIQSGTLELDHPVNQCSVSPDGRTLLSVGDSREINLHALSCGAPGSAITFERMSTLYILPQHNSVFSRHPQYPALFSSAFSSDGTKFAVSSQGGTVMVWDIRSSLPLKIIHTDKTRNFESVPYSGWGTRSLKFGGRAGKEILAFNEHTSLLHIVDARTFETEEIVRVPSFELGDDDGGSRHDVSANLAGLCFDPSGQFLYTGTRKSIVEWRLM